MCVWCVLISRIDAVHLCLFNVTIEHNHKYYDFDMDIFPWMERYWTRLHLGEVCSHEGRLWNRHFNNPHPFVMLACSPSLRYYNFYNNATIQGIGRWPPWSHKIKSFGLHIFLFWMLEFYGISICNTFVKYRFININIIVLQWLYIFL